MRLVWAAAVLLSHGLAEATAGNTHEREAKAVVKGWKDHVKLFKKRQEEELDYQEKKMADLKAEITSDGDSSTGRLKKKITELTKKLTDHEKSIFGDVSKLGNEFTEQGAGIELTQSEFDSTGQEIQKSFEDTKAALAEGFEEAATDSTSSMAEEFEGAAESQEESQETNAEETETVMEEMLESLEAFSELVEEQQKAGTEKDKELLEVNKENKKTVSLVDKGIAKTQSQIEDKVIPKVTTAAEGFPGELEAAQSSLEASASAYALKAKDAFAKEVMVLNREAGDEMRSMEKAVNAKKTELEGAVGQISQDLTGATNQQEREAFAELQDLLGMQEEVEAKLERSTRHAEVRSLQAQQQAQILNGNLENVASIQESRLDTTLGRYHALKDTVVAMQRGRLSQLMDQLGQLLTVKEGEASTRVKEEIAEVLEEMRKSVLFVRSVSSSLHEKISQLGGMVANNTKVAIDQDEQYAELYNAMQENNATAADVIDAERKDITEDVAEQRTQMQQHMDADLLDIVAHDEKTREAVMKVVKQLNTSMSQKVEQDLTAGLDLLVSATNRTMISKAKKTAQSITDMTAVNHKIAAGAAHNHEALHSVGKQARKALSVVGDLLEHASGQIASAQSVVEEDQDDYLSKINETAKSQLSRAALQLQNAYGLSTEQVTDVLRALRGSIGELTDAITQDQLESRADENKLSGAVEATFAKLVHAREEADEDEAGVNQTIRKTWKELRNETNTDRYLVDQIVGSEKEKIREAVDGESALAQELLRHISRGLGEMISDDTSTLRGDIDAADKDFTKVLETTAATFNQVQGKVDTMSDHLESEEAERRQKTRAMKEAMRVLLMGVRQQDKEAVETLAQKVVDLTAQIQHDRVSLAGKMTELKTDSKGKLQDTAHEMQQAAQQLVAKLGSDSEQAREAVAAFGERLDAEVAAVKESSVAAKEQVEDLTQSGRNAAQTLAKDVTQLEGQVEVQEQQEEANVQEEEKEVQKNTNSELDGFEGVLTVLHGTQSAAKATVNQMKDNLEHKIDGYAVLADSASQRVNQTLEQLGNDAPDLAQEFDEATAASRSDISKISAKLIEAMNTSQTKARAVVDAAQNVTKKRIATAISIHDDITAWKMDMLNKLDNTTGAVMKMKNDISSRVTNLRKIEQTYDSNLEALLSAGIDTNFDANELEMLQRKTEKLQQQERRQKEWQNRFMISEYAFKAAVNRKFRDQLGGLATADDDAANQRLSEEMAVASLLRDMQRGVNEEVGVVSSRESQQARETVGNIERQLQGIAKAQEKAAQEQEGKVNKAQGDVEQSEKSLEKKMEEAHAKQVVLEDEVTGFVANVAATENQMNGTALLPMMSQKSYLKLAPVRQRIESKLRTLNLGALLETKADATEETEKVAQLRTLNSALEAENDRLEAEDNRLEQRVAHIRTALGDGTFI